MKLLIQSAEDQPGSGTGQPVPLSRVLMRQIAQSGREDAASEWCQRFCEAINAKGQTCSWQKVNSSTLASVEDIEGIVTGMSLSAISEQMMVSQPAIKIQDECITLSISGLRKAPRFQSIPFPTPQQDHNASDQSQQPANTSTPLRDGAGNALAHVVVKQEGQGKRKRDGGIVRNDAAAGAHTGASRGKAVKPAVAVKEETTGVTDGLPHEQQLHQEAKRIKKKKHDKHAMTENKTGHVALDHTTPRQAADSLLKTYASPRVSCEPQTKVAIDKVTVGADMTECGVGTVVYFIRDKDAVTRIHSTWEGGEDIVCAVCGEEPRADRIVKECDYCLRNYHQDCAPDSVLWYDDGVTDLDFFPCPRCMHHSKPQPLPQSTNAAHVFIGGHSALGLGVIRGIYKLPGSSSRREDTVIELQRYLRPKELVAHVEGLPSQSENSRGVLRNLKRVGEALGNLDVARRVVFTELRTFCSADDLYGHPAQVFSHENFQSSDGEDAFLCDEFFCSKTQTLRVIDSYKQVVGLQTEHQWQGAGRGLPKGQSDSAQAATLSPTAPPASIAGPSTATPQHLHEKALKVVKPTAGKQKTPGMVGGGPDVANASFEDIFESPEFSKVATAVMKYAAARLPRVTGTAAVSALSQFQAVNKRRSKLRGRSFLTNCNLCPTEPLKERTLAPMFTKFMAIQAQSCLDDPGFADKHSELEPGTRKYTGTSYVSCKKRTARLQHIDRITERDEQRAGVVTGIKRYAEEVVRDGTQGQSKLLRGEGTWQRLYRRRFFQPVNEVDGGGNLTGRRTTWQDLALKGETQSIWEYLHEAAPDATYNLSDVDEDEMTRLLKMLQNKEKNGTTHTGDRKATKRSAGAPRRFRSPLSSSDDSSESDDEDVESDDSATE